jgi:hypothetical protein
VTRTLTEVLKNGLFLEILPRAFKSEENTGRGIEEWFVSRNATKSFQK